MSVSDDIPADPVFDDAVAAYHLGQYQKAMAGFSSSVFTGNPLAALYLADMHFRGEAVPSDTEKGLSLLRLAVSWGNSTAAFKLGALYRTGAYGVPADPGESRRYFLVAKVLGCEVSVDEFL